MSTNNWWILAAADGDIAPQENMQKIDATSADAEDVATDAVTTDTLGNPADPNVPVKREMKATDFILPAALVLLMIFMFRAPQKQKKEKQKILNALNKNDKIMTNSGIYGTIIDIRDDHIILKVDESTNTKIKIAKEAVLRNFSQTKD